MVPSGGRWAKRPTCQAAQVGPGVIAERGFFAPRVSQEEARCHEKTARMQPTEGAWQIQLPVSPCPSPPRKQSPGLLLPAVPTLTPLKSRPLLPRGLVLTPDTRWDPSVSTAG